MRTAPDHSGSGAGGSLGPEGPDEEQKQGSCLVLGPGKTSKTGLNREQGGSSAGCSLDSTVAPTPDPDLDK